MDPLFWALLLVALAVGLIVLEVFLPSAGLLGVAAAVCLVVAGAIALMGGPGWWRFLIVSTTTILVVPTAIAAAMYVLPKTPLGRTILAIPDVGDAVLPEHFAALRQQVGRFGLSRTAMMPAGVVVIDGKRYDAVSEGAAIEPGQAVRVVAVRVGRLVVTAEAGVDPADLAEAGAGGRPSPAPRDVSASEDFRALRAEGAASPGAKTTGAATAREADPTGVETPGTPPGAEAGRMERTTASDLSDEERQLRQSLQELGLEGLDLDPPGPTTST